MDIKKMKTSEYWISKLEMSPHPEGGYFKEVYRSKDTVKSGHLPLRYKSDRNLSTSIYFLLKNDNFSSFHKLQSDELWHFYEGSPVIIYVITKAGDLTEIVLGNDAEKGEIFQYAIEAGDWFAAEVAVKDSYSLVGCTVSPGFHFDDFELAEKDKLSGEFPQHSELITRLTR